MRPGWLGEQLPRVMHADPLLRGLVNAFEQVADTVLDRVDGLEAQADPDTASEEMLAYLASWIGLDLRPDDDLDDVRRLVRAVGGTLGSRGTVRGLETLLSAATGSPVQVVDGGGVFVGDDVVPVRDDRIRVTIGDLGPLSRDQVLAFCAAEIPVGSVVELTLGSGAS